MSTTVLDYATGKPVVMPDDQVSEAAFEGKVGLPLDVPLPVVDRDGNVTTMQGQAAVDAIRSGQAHYIGPDGKARLEHLDKYDSPAKAALLGALRGATLKLSDAAMVKSGLMSAEDVAGYEEVNPRASMAGEVVGTPS